MRRVHVLAILTILAFSNPELACSTGRTQEVGSQARVWPGMDRTGKVLLPNGWSLKPAGTQVALNGQFPISIAAHPTEPILALLFAGYNEHEVVTVNAENGRVRGRVALPQSYGGLVWSPDGRRIFAGGGFDQVIYRMDYSGGLLSNLSAILYEGGILKDLPAPTGSQLDQKADRGSLPVRGAIGGLAVSADGKALWAANVWGHRVARFNTETGAREAEIELEPDSYPYGLLLHEPTNRLFVSLWGKARVDLVATDQGIVTGFLPTQEHPNEMLLAKNGELLYVANANRNTVSVFNLVEMKAIETISTAIAPNAPAGSTPNALAITPDEKVLVVANADTNNLALFNIEEPGKSKPMGFIPTGWYPTSVRVSGNGKTIWVANGKGARSQPNPQGPNPLAPRRDSTVEYIGSLFEGTLQIVPMPDPETAEKLTRTVHECSPLSPSKPIGVQGPAPAPGNPIPTRVGDPSPIRYCIYVIKENRTYDQVFGDLPQGNGDPELCLFPRKVTPNHHALAEQFVLLDNFYVESEVSADGHEWTMGAYATDFVERTWPLSYRGDRRIPYVAEGKFPVAFPSTGYLWDKAAEKGVSYFSFGEFIENGPTLNDPATTKIEALKGHFDPTFRGYDLSYPDVKRTEHILNRVKEWEAEGEMPRLVILRLGNDHTSGTRPGAPTPTAMVADNDLALGKLVDGLSRSKFWPQMAIFVVEDDAQNGPDHVDAHRTVALVVSPYAKRRHVDSTMYSTSSMLRTMELILGLDPMTQFDASARPMYESFRATADFSPFTHQPAQVDLEEKNQPTAWGAEISKQLNLAKEDQADDLLFNEIIWRSVKGPYSPMPAPVRSAFVIPKVEPEEPGED